MGTKISKAEFEALPDALKAKFKAEGDDYILAEEDVEGLKKSKAEILAEKKRIQDELEELKRFKAEYEANAAKADEEKLKEAGAFKELEEKLRAKIAETEDAAKAERAAILTTLKTERLKNLVIEKGVLPDRAEYALTTLQDQFDLESGEQGFTLKLRSGIGDPKEIDGAIDGLKAKAAFLFAPNITPGSGASGNQLNGNGGDAKTVKRSEFDTWTPERQMAFTVKEKGTLVD